MCILALVPKPAAALRQKPSADFDDRLRRGSSRGTVALLHSRRCIHDHRWAWSRRNWLWLGRVCGVLALTLAAANAHDVLVKLPLIGTGFIRLVRRDGVSIPILNKIKKFEHLLQIVQRVKCKALMAYCDWLLNPTDSEASVATEDLILTLNG